MGFTRKLLGAIILALLFVTNIAEAQEPLVGSGLPLPRFVSLRSQEVNMRTGPGVRYPVVWVYKLRKLPLEVVAEFRTWRKVRDFEGTVGWMHQGMLSNKRTMAVTGQTRTLRRQADSRSSAVARIEPSTVGEIMKCPKDSGWCKLSFGRYEGWLRLVEFWGVHPGEKFN